MARSKKYMMKTLLAKTKISKLCFTYKYSFQATYFHVRSTQTKGFSMHMKSLTLKNYKA